MNALLNPTPGRLLLVIAPRAGGTIMLDLIARLACRGPLRLLDGGNCFDVYRCNLAIARALQGQKGRLPDVLDRIQLARAFTCYQMVALLKQTQAQPIPTLVLDCDLADATVVSEEEITAKVEQFLELLDDRRD